MTHRACWAAPPKELVQQVSAAAIAFGADRPARNPSRPGTRHEHFLVPHMGLPRPRHARVSQTHEQDDSYIVSNYQSRERGEPGRVDAE